MTKKLKHFLTGMGGVVDLAPLPRGTDSEHLRGDFNRNRIRGDMWAMMIDAPAPPRRLSTYKLRELTALLVDLRRSGDLSEEVFNVLATQAVASFVDEQVSSRVVGIVAQSLARSFSSRTMP